MGSTRVREIVRPGTLLALALALYGASPPPAHGRDLGQWENGDPVIRNWYQTLMQPDAPSMPCCGEADAYWADEVHVRDGRVFAKITDERDDAPLRRPHIAPGTEFEIPHEKLKWDRGNPTGHNILFVGAGNGRVFCFVQNGGI